MAEPATERTIDERVGAAREGLTLLADYLYPAPLEAEKQLEGEMQMPGF